MTMSNLAIFSAFVVCTATISNGGIVNDKQSHGFQYSKHPQVIYRSRSFNQLSSKSSVNKKEEQSFCVVGKFCKGNDYCCHPWFSYCCPTGTTCCAHLKIRACCKPDGTFLVPAKKAFER